ncbi:MAG: glutamine--fructose-6-phosphate transaminase (isomerizing) [Oscillospiraceae bacterium]|jgi:glucosamine--fructose-6-phosphate aminotransferase (isomerizing)|nr:glutamine--fructose-6-phosphate transaminase (isomerizing) [Oscillospiraceae bacterium]
MCGIMGVVGAKDAAGILVNGLQHLSYRGYDAAGVAILAGGGDRRRIEIRKTAGTLDKLKSMLRGSPVDGHTGIGHTRWATHGAPTDCNAHPHTDKSGRLAVVHNGIIENERALRLKLAAEGYEFRSQTDTEVVAHLVSKYLSETCDLHCALRKTLNVISGAYALVVMYIDEPECIYAARKDSPLVIGLGSDAGYVASDIPALLPYTREMLLLEDGDVARVTSGAVIVWDRGDVITARQSKTITWDQEAADKGEHTTFMDKEMDEQADAAERLLAAPLMRIAAPERVAFVSCGSAYHASMVGRELLGRLAGIPAEVMIASEMRYEPELPLNGTLCVAVSQSGETADTLAALRQAKRRGASSAAIVNVQDSSIAREADAVQWMHAGPEIAVATSKGYTTQVLALLRLALEWGRAKEWLSASESREWDDTLARLPGLMREVLADRDRVERFATANIAPRLAFFIGRGLDYAAAMEGALKLKEISYLNAEAYAAGELKHGPIALIESDALVVAVCTQSGLTAKTIANIREVKARGAKVLALCRRSDEGRLRAEADEVWTLPDAPDEAMPLLAILPLQRLAYETAILRGCSVDKPRNLAKSVTVE